MRTLFIAVIAVFWAAVGNAEMVVKSSPHDVATTMDRLVAAVEKAGAKVFARVDHAAGAASIGSELAPTQMLMFGNPKIGTPVMVANPAAGVDLPLRVVVYTGSDGGAMVAYHPPSRLTDDHGVPSDLPVLQKMAGALDKLTNAAIAE
ncbi:MAG: DUF302 domain-containing protein [Rhodobacteraceae bacterium]|nr:DUF302 domain-containing protein [Paracoccaceae bacterium]